jgi:excisionase family DNA binding protein
VPNNDVILEAPVEPRLLRIEEAAAILQVPRSWLYAATKRGAFPCVRLGKYVRIRPEDVEAWIASGGSA